jgi:hypothetical protein
MVEGEYYYVWDADCSGFMIGKCLGNIKYNNQRGDSDAILISTLNGNEELSLGGWCFKDYRRKYRKATRSEINWLKQCIKLNKFIDYPKIKAYEIW